MKPAERFTRLLIILTVLGVVVIPSLFWVRTPLVHARLPESGGWNPEIIRVEVGKPLHLRLTSDDVVHGFAVGKMDMPSVDVLPGKIADVILTFDKPGRYTFYCTRWCGINHWRMRGIIEVSGSTTDSEPASVPLYVSLGINLDAPHESPVLPAQKPVAARGSQLDESLALIPYLSTDYYRSHSPYEVYKDLATTLLTETQRWDGVAYIWQSNTSPQALANGAKLYAQNCAACHGESGFGDGVFANPLLPFSPEGMLDDGRHSMQQPATDFTSAKHMLGASPALLQGKILRGGMGTGMPMWGSIFTDEQTWDLVAYLYSFQFEY